jgi:hypothetical protein
MYSRVATRADQGSFWIACSGILRFLGFEQVQQPQGNSMKLATTLKITAAAACFAALAGCQDLKPIQAQIDDLKAQVSKLSGDTAKASSDAAAANSAAASASQAAAGAQSTANQALSTAQSHQSAIDAINEKIDRVFKKSVSK